MSKKSVTVIGHFGGKKGFYDGQTIKTKILCDELATSGYVVKRVDTYYKKKNPLFLLLKSVWSMMTSSKIIVLLSGNGMKFYFPLLYFYSRFLKGKVYHDVIGGNLDKYALENKHFITYLNSFQVNWVENHDLVEKLERIGVSNATYLPNFKRLNIINTIDDLSFDKPYKICTFSRVMKQKGIEEAINIVSDLNKEHDGIFKLDIYGQVDSNEINWFDNLQAKFPKLIEYKGIVDYDRTTEVLKDYLFLLFPTLFFQEGVPGTIIDAYAAGVPVIASKWEHFSDVIDEGVTGFGYAFGNSDACKEVLFNAIDDIQQIRQMKLKCVLKAKQYMPENVIAVILAKLEE